MDGLTERNFRHQATATAITGGATFDRRGVAVEPSAATRYRVAIPANGGAYRVDVTHFNYRDIVAVVDMHQGREVFGTWLDEQGGTVWVEPTFVTSSREFALGLATAWGERAIYDAVEGVDIRVD